MLSFGSGYKTGKSSRACTPPLRLYHPVLIEQRWIAGVEFGAFELGVIAWSAWIDMNMARIYRSKNIWPGVG